MDTRFETHRVQLEADLDGRGLGVTAGAWRPLQRLSWATLQDIHDHEEAFLRDELVESIVTANRTRRQSGKGTAQVNAHDVTTAMLMLGRAVTRASEASIAAPNKARIQQVCPYC